MRLRWMGSRPAACCGVVDHGASAAGEAAYSPPACALAAAMASGLSECPKNTTASAQSAPFLVAPKESTSTPA